MALESERSLDLSFVLGGDFLPQDYALPLLTAVTARLPWAADEPGFGIHAIRGALTETGVLYLNRRARLVVRVPRLRAEDAAGLRGATLDVAGHTLTLGAATRRPLVANAAQHAAMVILDTDDETRFMANATQRLAELDIHCPMVCGRRRTVVTPEGVRTAFSLLLHGLPAERSLRLQEAGIGGHRGLGAGLFLPHKSVSSVTDV